MLANVDLIVLLVLPDIFRGGPMQATPLDLVLGRLFNKTYPFQDVGDVVYPALLDAQAYCGLV